jgi:hypothetical protein
MASEALRPRQGNPAHSIVIGEHCTTYGRGRPILPLGCTAHDTVDI